MKKAAHIILLATAMPLVMADITLGTGGGIPATESIAPGTGEYTRLAQDVLAVTRELTAVLASVKDTASADAAAAQVKALTPRLHALQAKSESMPRPGAAIEAVVRSEINIQEVQQIAHDFVNALIQIDMNNAYGSQALLDAMRPLLENAIPGSEES